MSFVGHTIQEDGLRLPEAFASVSSSTGPEQGFHRPYTTHNTDNPTPNLEYMNSKISTARENQSNKKKSNRKI